MTPPTPHTRPNIHLALFLTRATPLSAWEEAGIFARETALYHKLLPRLGSISIVTSGNSEELAYQSRLGDIELLINRGNLSGNLYSLLAPILHRRALRTATIYKTNQLDGAWTALIAGWLYGKPVIVRAGYIWADFSAQASGNKRKARLVRALQRFVLRRADAIELTTESMKQQVIAEARVAADKITVVPNYVDTERFCPRQDDLERTPTSGRICFIGRLEPQKNLPVLLRAIAQLSNASLVLIGRGSQEEELVTLAAQHHVSVEFLGVVPNQQIPAEINRSDIFVLPSLYEGHPKVLIEAMACSAAIVGTAVEGIQNVIQDGVTGLLCPPTVAGLAGALGRLLSDAALRDRLGHAARAYAVEHFSLDTIVEQELALMQQLQARRQTSATHPSTRSSTRP